MVTSLIFLTFLLRISQQCQSRSYDNDGTVCVCNSEYCDGVPTPAKVDPPEFLTYTSNKKGLRFFRGTGTFTLSESTLKLRIDQQKQYQTILGWGGSFTDSTGMNIKALPKIVQEMLLQSYFSNAGIAYSLCRVPMGGTDFSIRPYTYDDGPKDPYLLNFALAQEDFLYKIPFIRKAVSLSNNTLNLIASPWAAPKWMRSTDHLGLLYKSSYQPWANYFIKFLNSYEKYGIKFWGVTTGNEPIQAWILFEELETVPWPMWLIGKWIAQHLGPTIRVSKYSDLKILIMDDQRAYLPWYLIKPFENNYTRQYVDGIAVHWYLDKYIPGEVLTKTHELFPEKFIISTEACFATGVPTVKLGSWERGEAYSIDIIENMQNWVGGWIDWNMALDLNGGPNYISNTVDAAIIVNATAGEFYKQPMFYHLGHFSKFVPRGSVRIYSNLSYKDVDHVAFRRPDNGTAVIILNRKDEVVQISIYDGTRGKALLKLSKRSITTVLYW